MILAEKITMLRKQNGWSQEELADKLDISRQSVSKWESTASVPDLDKIIKLSEIFGVSTDFLLKEEAEMPPAVADFAEAETSVPKRIVSCEEAADYMDLNVRISKWMALGVMFCICSPIALIGLTSMYEMRLLHILPNVADSLGIIILLVMVGIAVAIFILNGMQLKPYEYLGTEAFILEAGASKMVYTRKAAFEMTFRTSIVIGVLLCIFSVIPLFLADLLPYSRMFISCWSVGMMLFIVSCGVFLFVHAGMIHESFDKLLQEGDSSVESKNANKKIEAISGVYWCLITAIFLGYSFLTNDWGRSWIICHVPVFSSEQSAAYCM